MTIAKADKFHDCVPVSWRRATPGKQKTLYYYFSFEVVVELMTLEHERDLVCIGFSYGGHGKWNIDVIFGYFIQRLITEWAVEAQAYTSKFQGALNDNFLPQYAQTILWQVAPELFSKRYNFFLFKLFSKRFNPFSRNLLLLLSWV